ncbi:hypothetical protein HK100_011592, partial [Physocladia obscura]
MAEGEAKAENDSNNNSNGNSASTNNTPVAYTTISSRISSSSSTKNRRETRTAETDGNGAGLGLGLSLSLGSERDRDTERAAERDTNDAAGFVAAASLALSPGRSDAFIPNNAFVFAEGIEAATPTQTPPATTIAATIATATTQTTARQRNWCPVGADGRGIEGIAVLPFDVPPASSSAAGNTSTQSKLVQSQVALQAGDSVIILERYPLPPAAPEWFRGYVFPTAHSAPIAASAFTLGIFPASHVAVTAPKSPAALLLNRKDSSESTANHQFAIKHIPQPSYPNLDSIVGHREPLVDDLAAVLIEWSGLLKVHLSSQNYSLYGKVVYLSNRLYKGRNQLMSAALAQERLIKVRNQLIDIVEFGNYIQNLDMTLRNRSRGSLLGEAKSSSIIKVFKAHFESYERLLIAKANLPLYSKLYDRISGTDRFTISLTPITASPLLAITNPQNYPVYDDRQRAIHLPFTLQSGRKRSEAVHSYYIHFELSACFAQICLPGEHAELAFYLYDKIKNKPISEDFLVRIDSSGMPVSTDHEGKLRLKTVFCDVSDPESAAAMASASPTGSQQSIDTSFNLCLVVRIVRVGKMNANDRDEPPARPSVSDRFMKRTHSNESFMEARSYSAAHSLLSRAPSSSIDLIRNSISDPSGIRRPFAVGILDLEPIWAKSKKNEFPETNAVLESSVAAATVLESDVDRALMEGAEYTIHLYSPGSETMFPNLAEQILRQQDLSQSGQENIKVILNISAHKCTVAEPVPVSLLKVGFTQRLGFPERIHPNDSRNSVYITLNSGDFAGRASSFAQRNVQVKVQVRLSDGSFIDNCISMGLIGTEPEYDSIVYYHNNNPNWSETIRVDLEPQRFEQAHLFFSFRQCSSTQDRGGMFGFAFLPFVRSDFTVIKDDLYTIPLYKYDRSLIVHPEYLNWTQNDPTKTSAQLRDRVTIRTALCSTRMTQSSGILNLEHWIDAIQHYCVPVTEIISKFRHNVPALEIVKFLHGILDALLEILDSPIATAAAVSAVGGPSSSAPSDIEVSDAVFDSLLHVFSIVVKPRFAAYESKLEEYVDKFLRSTTCWRQILSAFTRLLERASNGAPIAATASAGRHHQHTATKRLCDAVNVWGLWIQFAVRSGLMDQKLARNALQQQQQNGVIDSQRRETHAFSDALSRVLALLAAFVGQPFDEVEEAQVLVLRNFMELLPYLERVYGGGSNLMGLLVGFVDGVNIRKPILNVYKLTFVHSLIRSPIFIDLKCRLLLVSAAKRWILEYFSLDLTRELDSYKIACLRLALGIAAEIIDKLYRIGDKIAKDSTRLTKSRPPEKTSAEIKFESDLFESCVSEMKQIFEPLVRVYNGFSRLVQRINITDPSSTRGFTAQGLNAAFRVELAETSAVILSLLHLLHPRHLREILKIDLETYGAATKGSGIGALFIVMQGMIQGEAFPDSWVSANMLIAKIVMKVLNVVDAHLKETSMHSSAIAAAVAEQEDFTSMMSTPTPSLHGKNFAVSMSRQMQQFLLDYFSILLQLLNWRTIATEYFKPQLARLSHRLEADVRGEAGELFRFAWKEIVMADDVDRSSISFLNSLFGPFLELTMSPHPKLRLAAVELLFSIIEHEGKAKGDFSLLEAECLDRLEGLIVGEGRGDQNFRRFFVEALGKYFSAAAVSSAAGATNSNSQHYTVHSPTETASISTNMASTLVFVTSGARFLKNVDSLIDIAVALRDIPSDARYNDERIWMTLQLIRGLYIRYIHKLSDLHTRLENTAEAALTLKLHGDLLPWSHDEKLDPLPQYGFHEQSSSFQRKEQIWHECISGLELTNNWERAIALWTELGAQYEKKWFSYAKYAQVLRKQADLIDSIMTKERYFPTYYRVGLYGRGHLPYLQGKQGKEWEKLASFCESLLNKFPGSQLLGSNAPPSDDVVNGNGCYIQITAVTPEIDRQRWIDGDINSAWYNWEYESERMSVDLMHDESTNSVRNTEMSTRNSSFRGPRPRSGAFITGESSENPIGQKHIDSLTRHSETTHINVNTGNSNNNIKYLMEPDLDPDADSSISKANNLLDNIPPAIKSYYLSNEICAFSYSRPFRFSAEDSNSVNTSNSSVPLNSAALELSDLWTEKTLFLTADTFPCLSQRSPVVKSFTIQLSPIENAIISVRTKTRQLANFLKEFENYHSESQNLNNFTLALNGAIDAPVN